MHVLSKTFALLLTMAAVSLSTAYGRGGMHGGAAPSTLAPSACGSVTVPSQAMAAGFTRCVFAFGNIGGNIIPTTDDTNSTNPGFNLYWNNGASPSNCTGSTASYSVNGTTGAVTTQSPLTNNNACWQLNTCAESTSTNSAIYPIIGRMLAGGYYIEGSLTYTRTGGSSTTNRNAFWGITPQVTDGWELDNPDIQGFGRNVAHWVGSSPQNETTTGSPNVGNASETNFAYGVLATPSVVNWYDNGSLSGGTNFTSGGGSPLAMESQGICWGLASASLYPTVFNYMYVFEQPFLSIEHAFGDDIGLSSTSPPSWPAVVASNEGLSQTVNNSAAGATACSASQSQVFANENPGSLNPIYTMLLGTNDAQNAVGQTTFTGCMEAMLTWLAIPQSSKVLAQSGCSLSGSWVADNSNMVAGVGEISSHTGDSITCTIGGAPSGNSSSQGPIYLWFRRCTTCGNLTYSVNGGGPNAVSGVSAVPGGDFWVVRLTNANVGTNYAVTFTLTGGGSGGGTTIVGVGTPSGTNSSRVVVGGIIQQFVNGTSCNNNAVTATYDGYLKSLIGTTLQQADGLFNISYAQTRFYVNNTSDMIGGSNCLEPNSTGQAHIAQAFNTIWP